MCSWQNLDKLRWDEFNSVDFSGGSAEAKHATSLRHWSSFDSSQLMSTHVRSLDHLKLFLCHFNFVPIGHLGWFSGLLCGHMAGSSNSKNPWSQLTSTHLVPLAMIYPLWILCNAICYWLTPPSHCNALFARKCVVNEQMQCSTKTMSNMWSLWWQTQSLISQQSPDSSWATISPLSVCQSTIQAKIKMNKWTNANLRETLAGLNEHINW